MTLILMYCMRLSPANTTWIRRRLSFSWNSSLHNFWLFRIDGNFTLLPIAANLHRNYEDEQIEEELVASWKN